MKNSVVYLGLIFVLGGCQWVKPKENIEDIAIVKPVHVQDCESVKSISTSVKDAVGVFKRGQKKVASELIILAKNRALELEADTIVPVSEPENGSQNFELYRCNSN